MLFEAVRGTLPKGARFTCPRCQTEGLSGADHTTIARVLHERHGSPYLSLADVPVDDDLLRLVPEDFARHHMLLPVLLKAPAKGKPATLVVAMCDPKNVFAVESLKRSVGIEVRVVVSTWAEIAEAIGEQYLRVASAEWS